MAPLLDVLSGTVCQRLTWTLLDFLWQGFIVAAAAYGWLRWFPARQAQGRYVLCLAALLAMALCPLITFVWIKTTAESAATRLTDRAAIAADTMLAHESVAVPGEPDASAAQAAAAADDRPVLAAAHHGGRGLWTNRARTVLRRAQPYMLVVWLAGVFLLSGRLLLSLASILRLARRRCRIPAELAELAADVARRLRLRRVPRVFSSERVREAIVVGFWRPVVLLPLSWLAEMPPDVLEAMMAHELAHIRRWDVWANLLQRLVETLLFYHPAVWWLSRRLSVEREMCADELAVAATKQRVAYAEALQTLGRKRLDQSATAQLASAMGGNKMMLLNRVRNILGLAPSRELTRWWPAGLLALLGPVGLVLSMGVAETEGQPQTFQVERNVEKSSWDQQGQVRQELTREANREQGADPFGPPNQARRLKSSKFRFREVYRAYRNPSGEIVRHGPLTVYHPDGSRLRAENWEHGELHGPWTDWRPDGRMLAEGTFQNGKKTGRWVQYDRDGVVAVEEEYSNDQPVKFVRYADSPTGPTPDRGKGRYCQAVNVFHDGRMASRTLYWPNGGKQYEKLYKNGSAGRRGDRLVQERGETNRNHLR